MINKNQLEDETRIIFEYDDKIQARYIIGERGEKTLFFIGLNPSTATPQNLDQTIKKIRKFTENFGYSGWKMFNLYPLRCTESERLRYKARKLSNDIRDELVTKNLEFIRKIPEDSDVCAVWGNSIKKLPEPKIEILESVIFALNKKNVNWKSIGVLLKSGDPRHPSRASYNHLLQNFFIDKYLENFKEK